MATTFTEYFASLYRHMMLIPESDSADNKVFFLIPPNQMDWQFTLTQTDDNEWEVHAIREYDSGMETPWEYKVYYKRDGTQWVSFKKN